MRPLTNTTIIYIPGLFDHLHWVNRLQRAALKTWTKFGGQPEVFTVRWADDAEFDPRLDALCDRVLELRAQGRQVALVGASAGGSAVVAALARVGEHVRGSVLICGKIHRPQIIPDLVMDRNEVFEDALEETDSALSQLDADVLARLVSLRSIHDAIVPPRDSIIKGAHNIRMPIIGHLAGIGYALLRYGRFVVKFCEKLEPRPPRQPVGD